MNKQIDEIKQLKKKVVKTNSSIGCSSLTPKSLTSDKNVHQINLSRNNANNNVNYNLPALTKKSKLEPIGVLQNRKGSSTQLVVDLSSIQNNFTINEDEHESSNVNMKEISFLMKRILEDN